MRRLRWYLDAFHYLFRDPWDDVSGTWARRLEAERKVLWPEQ